MFDNNQDGIYEITVKLFTAQNGLEFKFVHNDSLFELENQNNRMLNFQYRPEEISYFGHFNSSENFRIKN
jgi:hypothetical protein